MPPPQAASASKPAGSAPKRASAARTRRPKADPAPAPGPVREERIRQAAYAFYEQRGQGDGMDLDDWLKAEALIDEEPGGDAQAAASAVSGH